MGVVSVYVSDDDVISNLRGFFDRAEQYQINFKYWLGTSRKVKEGVLVNVGSRCFLLHEFTGLVIREVPCGNGECSVC